MFSKKTFILTLFLAIIISMGVVSASDVMTNCSDDVISTQDDNNYISIDSDINELTSVEKSNVKEVSLQSSDDLKQSSDESYTIFVGKNTTFDGGNGSYENPFATLDLACSDVNSFKDSVTVNIFEGTYYMTPNLLFNTSNLNIVGVNSSIVLKNSECIPGSSSGQGSLISFRLASGSGNFTMSNVIFDSSEWNLNNYYLCYFVPCACDNSIITFNNCTFIGYTTEILNPDQKNVEYLFNQCKFSNFDAQRVGDDEGGNVKFQYCIITAGFDQYGLDLSYANSITFDGIWWGQNSITKSYFYKSNGKPRYKNANYIFNRYAVFDISENYLGNNQYEIIGKLVWNGTDDNEGIDKLCPMTVTLSSSSGDLPETAILQDGTFRVIYNSTASKHDVTAKLDNEIITLNFNTTDMTVNTSDIIIGQDQNITVTLPQDFNGTLSIKVNNKTYNTTVDNTNSITYKIPDVLPAGKHVIDVIFADEKNHIYGFNSTNITVSKVSDYDFNATVTPTVYLGDNATVTIITLPSGAAGNVTVKVGDNEVKTFNVNDVISIDGFIAGDNVVNITFISDMYDAKSVVKTVVASPKPTTITTVNVTATYNVAKDLVISLTDVNGNVLANKTVNVVVGPINKNLTTNASGQVSMDISTLAPNTYVANITFAGDEVYAKSNATANVVVNKIASSLDAPAVTTTYNVAKNLVITLTANGKALANQKVTVKVGSISKTLTTDAKGQVSVDVSKLTPKTYTATFTYAGDDINDKSSNTAKVVVNKAKPKITAKKATFKAKKKTKKYSIVLKDNKGKAIKKAKVTLKVKGKTYKATTNTKGKATFKITKLTKKGKPTATIKFGGNTLYKAVSKKVKLTIKK